MARSRGALAGVLLAAAAVCLGLQLLAPAFVQPRAARAQAEVDPALAGAVAALAALPGEALAEGGKIPGAPLAGSPVCLSKPLVWLIYPLCDLVFLTSPIYLAPILFIFFGTIVTAIQLVLPATQPDEDLRA